MKRIKFLYCTSVTLTLTLACLSCTGRVKNFEYSSRFYRIQIADTAPFIKYFSVDALGNSKLEQNTIEWKKSASPVGYRLHKVSGSQLDIFQYGERGRASWTFKFEENKFSIISYFKENSASEGIEFRFGKNKNNTTLLGIMANSKKTRLPALLHFPDMGTFLLVADHPGVIVDYDASRKEGENYISIVIPRATIKQANLDYTFTATSVYPSFTGVDQEKYAGFRRNYLNLFQVNPRLQVLANNSCSDPCAFTLFLSSMLALKTPPLADSLSALDLLRMSIERYLKGMKAYGMHGYNGSWEDNNAGADNNLSQPYDYLDTYPSLVISACNYIKGSKDMKWAGLYYPEIKRWMDLQMSRDYNKNGLVEYELSGNSGSWNGVLRPANWWDTIGFGFEDAFSNALTYNALNLFVSVAEMIGKKEDAENYGHLAEKLKGSYFKTFYNKKTGVLAGWKSKDGKLHDYYFAMVNSMAVYYNLVPEDKIKDVMMAIWNKMQQVGYTDFSLGIPGNLVPVRRDDYTDLSPRFGCGKKDDGSDAFQRYENGGASLNWSYFALKAFKKAGLEDQYKKISEGILKGIDAGSFQGSCTPGGMTKDWKTWNGDCWGYEGFLCDGYLALLAFNPEDE
jgi:Bacterial alpha-L-rhamnosidase 6 hairpin glycosidase domain